MNGISHKQAIQFIDRRMDGMLDESQRSLLEEHLRSCDSCQAYAADMDGLSAHMQNEFHRRWDAQPGSSQNVFAQVTAQASRLPMRNRIATGAKLFAGTVALIALVVAINFVVSQVKNITLATNSTETVNQPVVSGDPLNPPLAFASDLNGELDIYTMHADGSGLTNITNDPARDFNPFWSPDGKRIAFERDQDGFTQIYVMDADGSNVTPLTKDETQHFLPTNLHGESNPWSPDGNNLLFLQQEAEANASTLYSLDINSGNVVRLANGHVQFNNLSWSPDGKYIGYVLNDSPTPDATFETGLYVIDAGGSNLIHVNQLIPETDSIHNPAYHWSRDGSSIVFIAYRHIDEGKDQWIAYEAVLESKQLIERATSSTIMDDWWEGTSFIHGTDLYTLTWLRDDNTFNTLKPLEICDLTVEANYGLFARRSPHGSQVINVMCPNKDLWFYYANPDGTIIKPLISSPIPSITADNSVTSLTWSSDDRFIAITLVSPAKSSLYILNVNEPAAEPREIIMSNGELYSIPSWRPVHTPQVVEGSPELKIDPQSCKPASELASTLQPPNELYGYDLVQGASFENGDFSYEVWLYCDPSLQPKDQEPLNTIAGLGIFASWKYTGPEQDGPTEYHFAFEPNDPIGASSWEGPLYGASITGAKFGFDLPQSTILERIQQGLPIEFQTVVNLPLGQNSATFFIYLEPTENGLRVVDLQANRETATSIRPASARLIAFTSPQDGNSEIFVMQTDGSGLQNITNHQATDRNPVWSPNGQQIAFESDRNGKFDVFVMNPDGSNVTQITSDLVYDVLPSSYDSPWSPDGMRLVIQSNMSGNEALYVVSADGKWEPIQISDTPGTVTWSPDGSQLAYSYISQQSGLNSNYEYDAVRIVNADGSNQRDVIQNGLIRSVHWSPDGRTLYYITAGEPFKWDIQRVNAEGGAPETIISFGDNYEPGMAWFSSDSTIVYASKDSQGGLSTSLYRLKEGQASLVGQLPDQSEICGASAVGYVMVSHDTIQALSYIPCDSGEIVFIVHDLINNTSALLGKLPILDPVEIQVDWSQDDQVITIRTVQSDVSQSSGSQASLYVIRRDQLSRSPLEFTPVIEQTNGLTKTTVQPVPNRPIISVPTPEPTQASTSANFPPIGTGIANGEWIAFIGGQTVPDPVNPTAFMLNQNIYLVRPDGSGLTNLTGFPAHDYSVLQWSPNGQHLLFTRENTALNKINILRHAADLATGFDEVTGPIADPDHYGYNWSPNSDKIVFADSSSGNYDMYTVYADGRNDPKLTQLTDDPAQDVGFAWSPDGSQITFQRLDGESLSVYVMNEDGSEQREVAHGSGKVKLEWSHDGTSIYASGTENNWLECKGCMPKPAIYRIQLNGPSVQQVYYEEDASKVSGWFMYDTPQNVLYFMRVDRQNFVEFWGTWFRADGNSVTELAELDPQQTCKTTTGNILNESISPNPRFSVISNFCAGEFDLYLADRETTAEKRLIHILRLPLDTEGQGGDFATLPIGWSPDGRWLIYENIGNANTYLLDIEKALQDPTTQPIVLIKPSYYTDPSGQIFRSSEPISLFGLLWQPKP